MSYRTLSIALAIILLGAGCIQPISPTTPTAQAPGTPSPEGPIAFREGFGKIPGRSPMTGSPRDYRSVSWIAKPPSLASHITVLRKRQTLPNAKLLQNLTTGLGIPAGLLQQSPTTKQLRLEWVDNSEYHWSYDAEYGRIGFVRSKVVRDALTVPSLSSAEKMGQSAKTFLVERGVFPLRAWGNPELGFSWSAWWKQEEASGRCMTNETIADLRSTAQDAHVSDEDIPRLPQATNASCSEPEFPNRTLIQFGFNQDGQVVYDTDGTTVSGAEIVVRSDTQDVESGTFELLADADRSNYDSISEQEMLDFLMRGGAGGFPSWTLGGTVVYNAFSQGLYRHNAKENDERRTFYIPAVRAEGIVTLADGNKRPLVTMIPLLPLDQYAGTNGEIAPLP